VTQVVIEHPVLNSPYAEPTRYRLFDDDGITNEIAVGRRPSSYFVPIAAPKKKGKQLAFETEWIKERQRENDEINRIRGRVAAWRQGGYSGVTPTTRRLLEYWRDPARENKLFFCQVEALETAIYITEAASRYGDAWIADYLRQQNADAGTTLPRMAFKMATGAGKTVVMAMLIAWHALNKAANGQDARFSDSFLVVAPGITIRDRLRVLLPNDPGNYYRERDLVPPDLMSSLQRANIVITNFHSLALRELTQASKLTKKLSGQVESGVATESPEQMVRRVCREFGNKRNIIVLNDEAHHCYRHKANGEQVRLDEDEQKEARQREEEARLWINGLEAVQKKLGIRAVYDLSATPFFLRGSGYPEGTLFGWVVSDFSLIDAIESGIVKVPRVPVEDNSMIGELPKYRHIWPFVRADLPSKGRKTESVGGEPSLPKELEAALHSLYANYRKTFAEWMSDEEARSGGRTPPVFIIVCNNTNVSKLVFDYVAGWERELPDGSKVLVPGKLDLFSNVENGRWIGRPNTILVDSIQLDSGEALSAEFKRMAATEIAEFKREYERRFPGRDAGGLTDEAILREVMNTVGKPGKLGEGVRCVVSVSMLTEGWDANTVTHILGVRAFGTQLLCEQVVGRALRRTSYTVNDGGLLEPEYAEVYGVPFSFIPTNGAVTRPRSTSTPTRVRALEDRIDREITFPRVLGYRYRIGTERLAAKFGEGSRVVLSTADIPTITENAPIVGEASIHTLDDLKSRRLQEVAFLLAKVTLERYFRADGTAAITDGLVHRFDGDVKPWLFPQLLDITRRWLAESVVCKDNTFPQLLLLVERAYDAADKIHHAIVEAGAGVKLLLPILAPYDTEGSTRHVDFDTTKPVWKTRPDKCHVSHCTADSNWEHKMAQVYEALDEVEAYVKNQGLGFSIPYVHEAKEASYFPDYIVRWRQPGYDQPLNLIVEVSGERKKDKVARVAAARDLWVPAINNCEQFGRWAFVEITDPWDAERALRGASTAATEAIQ
jgi:type III restriction enzyme